MTTDARIATFESRGHSYRVALLDDGLVADPTFLLFRDDEETAVVTAHLDPDADCIATSHIIVRRGEEE